MSKTRRSAELQALLASKPALKRLARAVRQKPAQGDTLRQRALDALPAALRRRVTLVEENRRWLALVETSASAQLLRFHLPILERALTGKAVKIVVTGRRNQAAGQPARISTGPVLDPDSADHIRTAAEGIDDDGLREALLRLAGRSQPD